MLKALILYGCCCLAQTNAALPRFDVASVKAAPQRDRRESKIRGGPGTDSPGYINTTSASPSTLIQRAYELKPYQCLYPQWMDEARYDVSARVPEGASKHESNLMMRQLLAERFELKAHQEKRAVRVYELRIGKGRLKIHQVAEGSEPTLTAAKLKKEFGESFPIPDPDVLRAGGYRVFDSSGAKLIVGKQPMERLADLLSFTVDRPVLDRTGVSGIFSFVLSWDPSSDAELGVSIFTAIEQQLGLRLQPGKAVIETLVVESARRMPMEISRAD